MTTDIADNTRPAIDRPFFSPFWLFKTVSIIPNVNPTTAGRKTIQPIQGNQDNIIDPNPIINDAIPMFIPPFKVFNFINNIL